MSFDEEQDHYMSKADFAMMCDEIKSLNATIAQLKEESLARSYGWQEANHTVRELREQLSASQERVQMLRSALVYHQDQTRPIQKTQEALAATAPAESDIDQATRYR